MDQSIREEEIEEIINKVKGGIDELGLIIFLEKCCYLN